LKNRKFYNKSSHTLFAARHHSAALIIVCLNLLEFVVISQAAYIHLIDVSCLLFTSKNHSPSFFGFSLSINMVFGWFPIAINIQFASIILLDFNIIFSRNIFHSIFSTSSFVTSSILFFAFTLSTRTFSALKTSLLCIIYTFLHISERYSASVSAVFHHPTTAIFLFLKNIQSHVAQ
jgi:hypothetical protein